MSSRETACQEAPVEREPTIRELVATIHVRLAEIDDVLTQSGDVAEDRDHSNVSVEARLGDISSGLTQADNHLIEIRLRLAQIMGRL